MQRARVLFFICAPVFLLALPPYPRAGAETYDIYRRLIASHSGVTVVDSQADPMGYDPDPNRWHQTWLTGEVWQNSSNVDWTYGGLLPGVHPVTIGGVPAPDVAGFFAAYLSLPTTQPIVPALVSGRIRVDLAAGTPGGAPVYYRTAGRITNLSGPLYGANYCDIYVRGTAIWLLPEGMNLRCEVSMHGTPNDRLIIVAQRGPSPAIGISLDNVQSQGIPLILVTDAQAEIRHEYQYRSNTNVSYLSMFAENIILMGPEPGTTTHYKLDLRHDSALDDAVLGPLYDSGALPNVVGTTLVRRETFGSVKVRYR